MFEDNSTPDSLENEFSALEKSDFSGLSSLPPSTGNELFEIESLFCRGELLAARAKAEELIASEIIEVQLAAQTYLMVFDLVSGYIDNSFCRFTRLRDELKQVSEDGGNSVTGPYVLTALIIEVTLGTTIFDLPDFSREIKQFPPGLKAYFGYLLAMRMLRDGNFDKALGIVFAYQTLVAEGFPESRIFLRLSSAIAHIAKGDSQIALDDFDAAWKTGEEHGIIMPFVTLHYYLMGLPRHYFKKRGIEEPREITTMARALRTDWHKLRAKCGFRLKTSSLTSMEFYTSVLASFGWSNKRIAEWLVISENTVKHHLTSSYQKLGISNRKGLIEVLSKNFMLQNPNPQLK